MTITLKDGRTLSLTQEHNRGSLENPMTYQELRAKFDDNAADLLPPRQRDQLAEWIANVEHLADASALVDLTTHAIAGPAVADHRCRCAVCRLGRRCGGRGGRAGRGAAVHGRPRRRESFA